MAADLRSCVFTNGFWSWDNLHKCLQFTRYQTRPYIIIKIVSQPKYSQTIFKSRDVKDQAAQGARIHTAASGLSSQSSSRPAFAQIKFRGTIDNLEQVRILEYQNFLRLNESDSRRNSVVTVNGVCDQTSPK